MPLEIPDNFNIIIILLITLLILLSTVGDLADVTGLKGIIVGINLKSLENIHLFIKYMAQN